MLIDPFVVVAQIINFLILVALLKRFLYKPITEAMEARSQRIERQLTAAASKEKDAEAEKELYQQKQQELAAKKQEWLDLAQQEVNSEKERLTQAAIAEVNLLRSQWYQDFNRDRQKFAREIRDRLVHQVTLATRKVLADLANADLEARIVEMSIERLYNLDDSQLQAIRNAPFSSSRHIITIRSSFSIPDEKRDRLIAAIHQQIATNAEIQFEIAEDLICGMELRDRGYKISWHLEQYLSELETEIAKVFAENNH